MTEVVKATRWIPADDTSAETSPFEAPNTAAGALGDDLPPLQVYDIFSDVEQVASAFQLNLPLDGNGKPIDSGDVFHLRIGSKTIFIARADYTTSRIEAAKRRLAVVGRDLGYFLVDNPMPFVNSFVPVQILNIARRAIVGSPIVGVVGQQPSILAVTIKTEPSEKRVAFLKRYMDLTDDLAFINAKGQLVIGGPSQEPPVGRFVIREGQNKGILDARVRRGEAMSLSECRVIMSNPFGLAVTDAGFWTEKVVPQPQRFLQRSQTIVAPQTAKLQDAKSLAQNLIARSSREDLAVEVTIRDHEFEGITPEADTNWEIDIDGDDPVQETLYMRAIRYARDKTDRVTTTMAFARPGSMVSQLRLAKPTVFGQ